MREGAESPMKTCFPVCGVARRKANGMQTPLPVPLSDRKVDFVPIDVVDFRKRDSQPSCHDHVSPHKSRGIALHPAQRVAFPFWGQSVWM